MSEIRADVCVVGAGPAGLAAAEAASSAGASVCIIERHRAPGRKFLLAGRSGLNLTHSEPVDMLLQRFHGSAANHVVRCVEQCPPSALCAWSESLGETTIVGSSGRVFPHSMRATPLLRAWLERLRQRGVTLHTEWKWAGDSLLIGSGRNLGTQTQVHATATVVALGGASWPRTGSDGRWVAELSRRGISIEAFGAANAGISIAWSSAMLERYEGLPIKNVIVRAGDLHASGDVVITKEGLEGGPIYAVSRAVREGALVHIDLRPHVEGAALLARFARTGTRESRANRLRKMGFDRQSIGLLFEFGAREAKDDAELVAMMQNVSLAAAVAPIDRAISTSGGVRGDEVDDVGMLRKLPGHFVCGEMLDWEAPTGGYLLQGCWSTGLIAGASAAAWCNQRLL